MMKELLMPAFIRSHLGLGPVGRWGARFVVLVLFLEISGLSAQGRQLRIGVLTSGLTSSSVLEGLREGLVHLGYHEGKHLSFLAEDVQGEVTNLAARAAKLVDTKPDLIFAIGTAPTIAAKQATTTLPIVFAFVGDPKQSGLVASYASSANNLTGIATYSVQLSGKRLEILQEIAPQIKRVLLLVASLETGAVVSFQSQAEVARKLGIELLRRDVQSKEDIVQTLEGLPNGSVDAISLVPSSLVAGNIESLIQKAKDARIPLIVHEDSMVTQGALVSYGADYWLIGAQAAKLVDKVLKGMKPSELAIQTPEKLFLAINLTTAKAIGLAIPRQILERTDRLVVAPGAGPIRHNLDVMLAVKFGGELHRAAAQQGSKRESRMVVAKRSDHGLGQLRGWLTLAMAVLLCCGTPLLSAQGRPVRVAVLTSGLAFGPALDGLREGLAQLGYREGDNLRLIIEDARGDVGLLPKLAAKIVEAKPDLIFTVSTEPTAAAKEATTSVPIVFALVADPLRSGFIASYASSQNNLTGVTNSAGPLSGKRLEILQEINPKIKRVLVLVAPREGVATLSYTSVAQAAPKLGLELVRRDVSELQELKQALQTLPKGTVDAMYHVPSTLVGSHIDLLIDKAMQDHLPLATTDESMVERGALASYGADFRSLGMQAAKLGTKILNGAKPSDLAVQAPEKLILAINLSTAKAIGLRLPRGLIERTDHIVE